MMRYLTSPLVVGGLTRPLVTKWWGKRQEPEIGYIASVGSSSSFYTSIYNVGSNNRVFYGDGHTNPALSRLGGGVTLLRDASNSSAFHFGLPGATFQQLLTASTGLYDKAIAAAKLAFAATGRATLIITQPGLNNIGNDESAATIQGYVETLMDRVEAAGPAVKLLITKAWPRLSSETNAAARLAVRLAVNSMLDAVVLPRGHGVAETADVGNDGSGYILTTWSDAVAPGHGTIPFSQRVGNIITAWMVANCRIPAFDLWSHAASMYPGKNPEFAGAGGSGGRPNGWSTSNQGASTHSWSTVDYGDGTGRRWMRMVCAANGSNGTAQLSWAAGASTGFVEGDVIEIMCEIRFPDPSGFAIGSISLSSFMGGTFLSPACGLARIAQQTPPVGIEYHTDKIVLRTVMTIVTSGTTTFDARINIAGSGTVDVGTMCAFVNNAALPQYYP
jgi:hypothetical protein